MRVYHCSVCRLLPCTYYIYNVCLPSKRNNATTYTRIVCTLHWQWLAFCTMHTEISITKSKSYECTCIRTLGRFFSLSLSFAPFSIRSASLSTAKQTSKPAYRSIGQFEDCAMCVCVAHAFVCEHIAPRVLCIKCIRVGGSI